MLASVILAAAALTLIWAIALGQAHAFEARQRILAAVTVEEIVAEKALVGRTNYAALGSDLIPRNGFTCLLTVTEENESVPDVGVVVRGKPITVTAYGADGRALATAEYFAHAPP